MTFGLTHLRKLAQGQECQIRLPGICNFNKETTVLAHFRLIGHSGLALKNHDILGAWACSACHEYVDTHHDNETQLYFAHGVMRTQIKLVDEYGELIDYSQGN